MQPSNPYAVPQAKLADPVTHGKVNVLSYKGRLGRIRYIGFICGEILLMMLLTVPAIAAFSALLGKGAEPYAIALVAALGIVLLTLLTIQRAHDFNARGWLALLLFVPLVNLLFWVVPGSKDANRFGLPPPPNQAGDYLRAILLAAIVFGVTAFTIDATNQYKKQGVRQEH